MLLVRLGPVSALRCSYCRLRRPETLSPFYCLFPDNHPKTSLFPDVSGRPPTPPGGLVNRKGRPLRAFYPGISPYEKTLLFGSRQPSVFFNTYICICTYIWNADFRRHIHMEPQKMSCIFSKSIFLCEIVRFSIGNVNRRAK